MRVFTKRRDRIAIGKSRASDRRSTASSKLPPGASAGFFMRWYKPAGDGPEMPEPVPRIEWSVADQNLEAAVAMFAVSYNYCWQIRMPHNSGKKRPTAAMIAGLAGHVWSLDELFAAVLT